MEADFAAEFLDALAHAADADADAAGAKLNDVLVEAFAVVADFDDNLAVRIGEAYPGILRAGVT